MSEVTTIHVPFRDWLSKQPGIAHTYHRPDKATGATLGDADFVIYKGPCYCLHLEAKDKNTSISKTQKKRHAELAAIGIRVRIFRDVATGIELVNAWLSILPAASTAATAAIEAAQDRSKLRQHKDFVYITNSIGRYFQLRKCGPGDAHLPQLFGK